MSSTAVAGKCQFLEGTQADDKSPCDIDGKTLFDKTSLWLDGRINAGTRPAETDVAALKSLIGKAFEWMAGSKVGASAEFAEGLGTHLKDPNSKADAAFIDGMPAEFEKLLEDILAKGEANATDTLRIVGEKTAAFVAKMDTSTSIRADSDTLNAALFSPDEKNGAKLGLVPWLEAAVGDKSNRPAQTVIRRANALNRLLDTAFDESDAAKKKIALARRAALRQMDVIEALARLGAHAEKLGEPLGPKLHIVRAWYGHLGRRWSEGAQCSATNAVQKLCERKQNCSVEPIAGGSTPDPVKLCGVDPAPYVRGLARGLAVEYSCESGDAAFWRSLEADPFTDPRTGQPLVLQTAVLRSSSMSLTCAYPVP